MRDQIKQLTDGEMDASKDSSGGLSLPGHVSETGPLKRQLINLQHAMKVGHTRDIIHCNLNDTQARRLIVHPSLMPAVVSSAPHVCVNDW